MDVFSKLSREAQVVLGGGLVLFIFSFLPWHKASFGDSALGIGGSVSWNEWHGIGFFAALLVIAMLAWEVVRVMGANVSIGSLSPGLVSAGLALLAALFTVIAVLTADYRNWPAWISLILALIVGAAAVVRALGEGVEMPQMPQAAASGGSTAPAAPAPPAPPAEPAMPAEATDEPSE